MFTKIFRNVKVETDKGGQYSMDIGVEVTEEGEIDSPAGCQEWELAELPVREAATQV